MKIPKSSILNEILLPIKKKKKKKTRYFFNSLYTCNSRGGKTKNLLTKTKNKNKKRVFSKLELANRKDLNIYTKPKTKK